MDQKNTKPKLKEKKKNNPKTFWIKVGLFLATDILCVIGILNIGTTLTKSAEEVKKLRATAIGSDTTNQKDIIEGELQKHKESSEKLLSYFPNDDEILDFVIKIDEIKKEGLISSFDFVTNEPVKDKLGLLSIPVLLTIKGEERELNLALEKIANLPYVTRPVTVNLTKDASESASWTMQWGAVLYVDEHYDQD